MAILGLLLLIVGGWCVVAFQIQLMVRAFKTSTAWGWVYLVVPLGAIFFIARHWGICKKPFLRMLGSIAIGAAGVGLLRPYLSDLSVHFNDKMEQCASEDDEVSMSACTSLIQSGRATTEVLAAAYNNRGQDYNNMRSYDKALADLDKAIALQADFAEAYTNRGIAHGGKGAHDQAIADHSKAIALEPDVGEAYENRGNEYLHQGLYEQAIADYSKAIALDTDSDDALWGRSLAFFYLGRYDSAQADLGRIALDHDDPYPAIWLCMTSQRLGADGKRRLAERAASFSRTDWPAPIVQLFLGRATTAEVLAAARDDDPPKASKQSCEAAFYIAEHQLAKSDHATRLALFEAAEQACKSDPTMVEAEAARLELKQLREPG
jgi:lipoprotein NlpI